MDPLSIAASAAALAQLAGNTVNKVRVLIAGAVNADDSLQEFHSGIANLEAILQNIELAFKTRPRHRPIEYRTRRAIGNVINSCRTCLYSLNDHLPDLPDSTSTSAVTRAVKKLMLSWKSESIAAKLAHIATYTQCLSVSMSTMTLITSWCTQDDQEDLRMQMVKLSEEIRQTGIYGRRRNDTSVSGASSVEEGDDIMFEKQTASRNLAHWVSSTQDAVSVMMTFHPDQIGSVNNPSRADSRLEAWVQNARSNHDAADNFCHHMGSVRSRESPPSFDDDESEDWSDVEIPDPQLPPDDVAALIEEHRRAVDDQMIAHLYKPAERDLKKLVNLLKQTGGEDCDEVTDCEEKLVRVLREQGTKQGLAEAKTILKKLLARANSNAASELEGPCSDTDECEDHSSDVNDGKIRVAELEHSLASIYLELRQYENAVRYAKRALNGMKQSGAALASVDESYLLLASVFERQGDYPSAIAMRKRVSEPERVFAINAFEWLQNHGFLSLGRRYSNDSPSQYLNMHHPATGQTPLQHAINHEENGDKGDVVRALLARGAAREVVDKDGATPLLIAASMKNKYVVAALLEKGVNTAATDRQGSSALHRVQTPAGGVGVARLLLGDCPERTINVRDGLGRTPLHLAASQGNEEMVAELLSRRAFIEVNAKDCVYDTPLHLAVGNARPTSLIRKLLHAGANVDQQNLNGKDALQIAKAVIPQYQMEDTKKLLEEWKKKNKRRTSAATSHTAATSNQATLRDPSVISQGNRHTFGLAQFDRNVISRHFSRGGRVSNGVS